MGEWLRSERLTFDAVLASPAVRIRETVAGVEEGLGRPLRPEWRQRIYMASAATLFDLVRDTPDEVEHLLLIGHNPGLEDLALLATRGQGGPLRDVMEGKYPTAAFAALEFPVERWADVDEGGASLTRFIRPRDLDPALGPEE